MEKLDRTMDIISMLVEQAVPYSLAYFLGTVEQDEDDEDDDEFGEIEEGDEGDEDDKKGIPPRKRKKSSNVDDEKK